MKSTYGMPPARYWREHELPGPENMLTLLDVLFDGRPTTGKHSPSYAEIMAAELGWP